MNTANKKIHTIHHPYFMSWSGGKDSYLALSKAIKYFGKPKTLLTMLIENGQRSRGHGIKRDILSAQAERLNIPISFRATSWDNYENTFDQTLLDLKSHAINAGVFGDIKIEENNHREFADSTCMKAGMKAIEPLWQLSIDNVQKEFLLSGIKTIIVAVDDSKLDKKFLGKIIDEEIFHNFYRRGIHPLGERGEYHTLVVDAPIFSQPLKVEAGVSVLRDGYWFLDLHLA